MFRISRSASRLGLRMFGVSLVLLVGTAHARVDCRGPSLRTQVAQSTDIFVGRLDATEIAAPLPEGQNGVPDMHLTFVVTRVLAGTLEVGDHVRVRWEGFVEPPNMRVGGCRVPATVGAQMLVLAEGAPEALRVPNATRSTPLSAANRETVRRVARLVRRR
ncbi:MAG: hypothetical protein AB8I08_34575 [Sandaracinaceae bacterium]